MMVSVIIVVYNASKYLRYAIESVFKQSFKNFEIIVVDDGSTDSTLQILNEYNYLSNFTIVNKKHTKNLGGNRNEAIKMAKGEIIAFIDGDDIWEEEKLATQIQYLEYYDMVCSNSYVINENNELVSQRYNNRYNKNTEISLIDLLTNNFIVVSSVLIKKSAVQSAGYFEDGPDTRAEDYVLWLNYLEKNKIFYINKPLLRYRKHSENWSNSNTNDWIRLLERTINIRRHYLSYSDKNVRKSAIKGCIASYLLLFRETNKAKDFISALKYLKKLIVIYDRKYSIKYIKFILGYIYIYIQYKITNSHN